MRTKLFKGFAIGLALVVIALAPACRSTRKRPPKTTTATETTSTVPDVPTMTETAQQVDTQPQDFVQDTQPTVEELPRDTEALNRYVQEKGLVRDAFFGYDESALSPEAQAALTSSAEWLRANAQYSLLVEGHCDERGTEQYNLALGDRRANVVRDYLIALGVDGARIRTVSYGEERPFEPGHNDAAWAQNRRAHLVVTGSNP